MGGRERQHQEPASQQGGKDSEEGKEHKSRAKVGAGDGSRKDPQLEVLGQRAGD